MDNNFDVKIGDKSLFDIFDDKLKNLLVQIYSEYFGLEYKQHIKDRLDNTTYIVVQQAESMAKKETFDYYIYRVYEKNYIETIADMFEEAGADRKIVKEYIDKIDLIDFLQFNDSLKKLKMTNKNYEIFLKLTEILGYKNNFKTEFNHTTVNESTSKKLTKVHEFVCRLNNLYNAKYNSKLKLLQQDINNITSLYYKEIDNCNMMYDRYVYNYKAILQEVMVKLKKTTIENVYKDEEEKKEFEKYLDIFFQFCENFDIEAFSEDDTTIESEEYNSYVKLFNYLGFNKGNDLKDYLDDSVLNKIFNQSTADRLDNCEYSYYRLAVQDNTFVSSCIDKISKLDVKSGTLEYIEELMSYVYNTNIPE